MRGFYIQKLGCPKNDADADLIAGFLIGRGMHQVARPEDADLLIANTCGFIQPAKEESIAAILELAEIKAASDGRRLVVTGCLSQRYAEVLRQEMPEIDGIFGIDDFVKIPEVFETPQNPLVACRPVGKQYAEYDFRRTVSQEEVFAYIKIADGCNNRCSYCAIPDIRGAYRSRRMEAIVDEARYLLDQGKRELILVSQEATAYGIDLYGRLHLLPLLEQLSSLPGRFWVRVLYLHPARLTRELVDYMVDNPRVCAYFDLPLQHSQERMLRLMNRTVTTRQIEELVDYIRARPKRSAVRTAFIVGFPGETEAEFEELCRFVERFRFERMGAFLYSPEEGTPARLLPGTVAETVKQERLDHLMLLQQEIAFANNRNEIGRPLEVLVETVHPADGFAVGRTRFDAPEIDQTVHLEFADVRPGDFVTATIIGSDGYDLVAKRGDT